MNFTGKSVRSLTQVLKKSGTANKVRFIVPVKGVENNLLIELGFDDDLNVGDYLMPSALGKFTYFNANGNEKIRKDLPKNPESVMFYGASRDWGGGIQYGVRIRTMDKYPREYIPAPSETFEIISVNGELFVSSSELNLGDPDEARNILVTNLMLECFTEFEIFDTEKQKTIGPKLKRLQWDVLPPGEYPWEKSKAIITKVTSNLDEKDKKVIEHRMQFIARMKPDFLATGRAGFNGYFVYGFKYKNVYVLESVHLDNATYVFNSDWESLSQLTKSEIIKSNISHNRIIHNRRWRIELSRVINEK